MCDGAPTRAVATRERAVPVSCKFDYLRADRAGEVGRGSSKFINNATVRAQSAQVSQTLIRAQIFLVVKVLVASAWLMGSFHSVQEGQWHIFSEL